MEQDAGRGGADVLVSSDLSAVDDLIAKGQFRAVQAGRL